jgi:hypothetical protein
MDLRPEPAADADAQARVHEPDGAPAGWLAVWLRRANPSRTARRIDARVVDPHGAPAWLSLVRPPEGVRLSFDDLAVQQARRAVLASAPPCGPTIERYGSAQPWPWDRYDAGEG